MRRPPPDQRKGPLRRPAETGPTRINVLRTNPIGSSSQTQAAFSPGRIRRRSQSLHAVAARLREDGLAAIGIRLFGLRASHRLSCGGTIDAEEERPLRRLHVQRRRQLAALARLYP